MSMDELSNDELATLWKACDVLAVQALKARTYSALARHNYVVEDNETYFEALAARDKIGGELEKRGVKCSEANK